MAGRPCATDIFPFAQAFAKLAFTPESKGLVSIFFGQTVR